MKQDLKLWNNKVFGNVGIRKINLLNDLRLMKEKRNSGYLSEEDR